MTSQIMLSYSEQPVVYAEMVLAQRLCIITPVIPVHLRPRNECRHEDRQRLLILDDIPKDGQAATIMMFLPPRALLQEHHHRAAPDMNRRPLVDNPRSLLRLPERLKA